MLTLGALSAFGPVSLDLYLPAFPEIAQSFGVSTGDVQLTFAACLLGLGLGQLVYGPLSDRFGRKPPLLAGLVLYVAASLLCAAAPSLVALTSLRFVQGLGGCAGLVIARAIVRDGFDGPELTRSFSVIASVSMVAPLLAPSAGALVLRTTSWRVLFVVIAAFGAACLVAALRLPETHPHNRRTEQGLLSSLAGYGRLLANRSFVLPASIAALGSGTLLAYIS
ncbi:MAG: Bcr/CflA family efflux MFS transporter, partial [Candidatus Nanopelagicales bacterium]